jgi:hypothetical protein
MEQDPFAGTGQDAGQAYAYGADPGIHSGAPAGREDDREGFWDDPAGREARDSDDAGRIRSFLEEQLRERPLPTLLLGVLAGWIAGKLLR